VAGIQAQNLHLETLPAEAGHDSIHVNPFQRLTGENAALWTFQYSDNPCALRHKEPVLHSLFLERRACLWSNPHYLSFIMLLYTGSEICGALRAFLQGMFFLIIGACIPGTVAGFNTSSHEYTSCMTKLQQEPKEALEYIQDIPQRRKTMEIRHCQALAFFAMEEFGQAAAHFDILHDQLPTQYHFKRLELRLQAARAWVKASDTTRALNRLDEIMQKTEDRYDNIDSRRIAINTLLQRSEIYNLRGKPYKAINDLDHALILAAFDSRVLLKRARIYLSLGELASAETDLQRIIQNNPRHNEARRMLAEIANR
jgi:tetratricopeptide (TPR) repeat protein